MKYDLEERTARFAEMVILLCKKAPKNVITNPIVLQLIRAATSVGANYCEANGASSKKDFKNKIFICKKEIKEAKYWLRMLVFAVDDLKEDCKGISQEAPRVNINIFKDCFQHEISFII